MRWPWQRNNPDEEIERELEAHLALEAREQAEAGRSTREARWAAQRALGNFTLIKEETRLVWLSRRWEQLAQDLHCAIRQLRLSPGFTVVATLSLALGIGTNTALFQLVDAIRLRVLPVASPEELALIKYSGEPSISGAYTGRHESLTHPQFEALAARQQAFTGLLAFNTTEFNLARGGEARRAEGLYVSSGFFDVLGVPPLLGRTFTHGDDQPPCPSAGAVLDHAFWQREYRGDPGVLGRNIHLNGHAVPIVGVAPPEFAGVEPGRRFDVAVPLCIDAVWGNFGSGRLGQRSFWWLTVLGRVSPGWTHARATAHLRELSTDIMRETVPNTYRPDQTKSFLANRLEAVPAATGVSDVRRSYETPLWFLLGTAGLVLLIACANLANLLLARASARQREMALRQAIGGSRSRLVRQLLAESVLLAMLGASLGVMLAQALSRALLAFVSRPSDPVVLTLNPDWRVLLFTAAMATLTCLLFGLLPAVRASRVPPVEAMKAGGRGATAGRDGFALRRALVAAQVALSLALLVGALLFARSLRNLTDAETGFRAAGVLVADVVLSPASVAEERRATVFDELRRRLAALPGVTATSMVAFTPISGARWSQSVFPDTDRARQGGEQVLFNRVGEGYFRTLGAEVLAGRDFSERDHLKARPVAILNEACARKLFGDARSAIGRHIRTLGNRNELDREYEVVGLVRNMKYRELREEFQPTAFLPFSQDERPGAGRAFTLRVAGPAGGVLAEMRSEAARLDPQIGLQFRWLDVQIQDSLRTEQLLAWLSGGFGLLAAVLSTVGLYGVVSYLVARRRNEIGIRMALGADEASVVRLVLGDCAPMVVTGLVAGLLLAIWAGQAARSLLFGLQPHDPATLAAATVLLVLVAVAASYLPARRAAGVDPGTALRQE